MVRILKRQYKRFVMGAIMAILFVSVAPIWNYTITSWKITYYENVAIEQIISKVDIKVEDLCLGESEQVWLGTREVGYQGGISANITRELYRLIETEQRGQIQAKIYEESADIFIDPVTESSRIQTYERLLEEGEYVWQLKFNELRLPGGVIRIDAPVVRTNIFEVKDCSYDPIQE